MDRLSPEAFDSPSQADHVTLDSLPQEIFDVIFEKCDIKKLPSRLSAYATICERWQYAVERIMFKSLSVGPNETPELEYFLSDDRRRSYLRTLNYRIAFASRHPRRNPSYNAKDVDKTCNMKLRAELKRLWALLATYWVSCHQVAHHCGWVI